MLIIILNIFLFPRDFTIESDGSIWIEILLNLLSTAGGFGIAWFFFAQERRREHRNENERIDEIAVYTRTKLTELADGMNAQVVEILKFTESLKRNRDADYFFSISSRFTSTSFSLISRVDLYRIYVTQQPGNFNENITNYNRLVNIIDNITEFKSLLPQAFRNFIERKEKHTEQWNEAITSLHRVFDTYSANMRLQGQNPDNDTVLSEFYRLKYEWAHKVRPANDSNFRDLHITYIEFIEPLYEFVKDHFEDPRSQIFMNYILECIAAFKNIEYIKRFYRRNFILDARRIQKMKLRLAATPV